MNAGALVALAVAATGAVALAAQAPTAWCEALSGLKVQDVTAGHRAEEDLPRPEEPAHR